MCLALAGSIELSYLSANKGEKHNIPGAVNLLQSALMSIRDTMHNV